MPEESDGYLRDPVKQLTPCGCNPPVLERFVEIGIDQVRCLKCSPLPRAELLASLLVHHRRNAA